MKHSSLTLSALVLGGSLVNTHRATRVLSCHPSTVTVSRFTGSTLLITQTLLAARRHGSRHARRPDTQTVNMLKSHLAEFLLFACVTLISLEQQQVRFYQAAACGLIQRGVDVRRQRQSVRITTGDDGPVQTSNRGDQRI